jgi:hypothetical protein
MSSIEIDPIQFEKMKLQLEKRNQQIKQLTKLIDQSSKEMIVLLKEHDELVEIVEKQKLENFLIKIMKQKKLMII